MSNLSTQPIINPENKTQDLYKTWRQRFVTPILAGSLVFGLIIIIPAVITAPTILSKATYIIAYAVTLFIALIPFPYPIKMGTFLTLIYMLGINELMSYGILGDSLIFFMALIIFATMMFSPRVGIIAVAIDIATFAAFGWLISTKAFTPLNPLAIPSAPEDWFITGGLLSLFSLIIILGFQRLEADFNKTQEQVENTLKDLRDERNNLDLRVNERTKQLRRVNEIGRQITSILDPDELLARSAQLAGDEFECYYAAIYLLDVTGRWVEIKEATGEAGKVLRENRHRLDINSRNLVCVAIRNKQVQIAQDAALQVSRAETQLLPYTRSQIAMPLIVRERALGALELHSTKNNIFSEQDEDTFLNLANEIAIALENSRLFREAQQTLAEMRATQRQYLQSAWVSVASEQELEYEIGDREYSGKAIQVPLALRDQILGQIDMASEEWTQEQKNLIESIATQAALALENARLVEESQSIATRERLANEIIAKVWSSATMDAILQTTVRELGRALEAAEVDIEVSMAKRDEQ